MNACCHHHRHSDGKLKSGEGLSKYCGIFQIFLSIQGSNTASHPWGSLASKSNELFIRQVGLYLPERQVRMRIMQNKRITRFFKKGNT